MPCHIISHLWVLYLDRDSIRYDYAHSILPYGAESVWNDASIVPGHRVSLMIRVSLHHLRQVRIAYQQVIVSGRKKGSGRSLSVCLCWLASIYNVLYVLSMLLLLQPIVRNPGLPFSAMRRSDIWQNCPTVRITLLPSLSASLSVLEYPRDRR